MPLKIHSKFNLTLCEKDYNLIFMKNSELFRSANIKKSLFKKYFIIAFSFEMMNCSNHFRMIFQNFKGKRCMLDPGLNDCSEIKIVFNFQKHSLNPP